jgi:3-methyl-2-oxobutanoate hydroxymethyltransferase
MLGLDPTFSPKYVKRYADLNQTIKQAVGNFRQDVRDGKYPDKEHTYH